jgi:hypothetical protein
MTQSSPDLLVRPDGADMGRRSQAGRDYQMKGMRRQRTWRA